jgi:hypothetical protein
MDSDPYGPNPTAPTAPSPGTAPSPPVAPQPARYSYLVGRLRTRQITMEEATELFTLQQAMLVRIQATVSSPPPSSLPGPRAATRAPSSGGAASALSNEDVLWESMPVLAGALGILAAVLKRSQEPPGAGAAPPPPAPAAPARKRPPGSSA